MSHRKALLLILLLFFCWGFLTALNDVLVADFRALFSLSYRSATAVQLTFFLTCFAASFPSSRFLSRFGHKGTMMLGLAGMTAGSLCFVLASTTVHFGSFLLALIVLASGSTALQTAAGPYVLLMRPDSPGVSQFSLALGINSLGAMLGPAFGAAFLIKDAAHANPHSLAGPFTAIACGILALALLVAVAHLPRIPGNIVVSQRGTYGWLARRPRFVLGVLSMMLYVGAEIAIGSLLINFLGLKETLGLQPRSAAFWTSLYWAGSMTGRFIGWALLKRIRQERLLCFVAGFAFILAILGSTLTGFPAAVCLLAVGLCNSVMVPILFNLTIYGLGPATAAGSGLLVAALVGGALIPFCQGALADRIGLRHSFFLPASCYIVIAGYGFTWLRGGWRDEAFHPPDEEVIRRIA